MSYSPCRDIVCLPGLPEMYQYEHTPQEVPTGVSHKLSKYILITLPTVSYAACYRYTHPSSRAQVRAVAIYFNRLQ